MCIKEDKMRLQILTVATSMFILASGMAAVKANSPPVHPGPMRIGRCSKGSVPRRTVIPAMKNLTTGTTGAARG